MRRPAPGNGANMQAFRIAVLPGDGIGPEVTAVAVALLRRVADDTPLRFRFEYGAIGAAALALAAGGSEPDPLPEATRRLCLDADAVLLGAVGDAAWDHLP